MTAKYRMARLAMDAWALFRHEKQEAPPVSALRSARLNELVALRERSPPA